MSAASSIGSSSPVGAPAINYEFKVGEIAFIEWQGRFCMVFIHKASYRTLSDVEKKRKRNAAGDKNSSAAKLQEGFEDIRWIPIYWISFPGYNMRIVNRDRWWADETDLIKADSEGISACSALNEAAITRISAKISKSSNKESSSGKHVTQVSQDEKLGVEAASPWNGIKLDPVDILKMRQRENSEKLWAERKEKAIEEKRDCFSWWRLPRMLRRKLRAEFNNSLNGIYPKIPKLRRLNVDTIVSDFKSYVKLSAGSLKDDNFDPKSSFSSITPADYAKFYEANLPWIDLWVDWFNEFFLCFGTYSLKEYEYITETLELSQQEQIKLSSVLGVEHLSRCLDPLVICHFWLNRLTILSPSVFEGCKMITQLFVRYLTAIYNDFSGDHTFTEG